MQSKTQQALALIDKGLNPHAAAVQVGLKSNTVYVALAARRRKGAGLCPHCGQPLPKAK